MLVLVQYVVARELPAEEEACSTGHIHTTRTRACAMSPHRYGAENRENSSCVGWEVGVGRLSRWHRYVHVCTYILALDACEERQRSWNCDLHNSCICT